MAFPSIVTSGTSAQPTTVTTHSVTLPSGIAAGNLLIVLFGHGVAGETPVFPTTWGTIIETDNAGGANEGLMCCYLNAAGTESGTITVTTAGATKSSHVSLRITGHNAGSVPAAAGATGNNQAPNPPSLSPAGGTADYLWLACGASSHGGTYSSFPADYTHITPVQVTTVSSGGGATDSITGVAARQFTADTDDPAQWAHDESAAEMVGVTIAVYPASAPETPTITTAEATQTQSSDAAVIAPIYLISTAESTQAQVSDAAILSLPAQSIDVAEGTQAQVSDAAPLIVICVIQPAENTQAQTSDAAIVAAVYLVQPAENTQTQVSDAATATAIAVIAPAENTQTQTSDAADVSQSTIIETAEGTQTQVSDAAIITATYLISPAESTQTQASDAADVSQSVRIDTAGGNQAQTSDAALISVIHLLSTAESTQTQVSDAAGISFEAPPATNITPAEASQTQSSDAASIIVTHVLTISESTQTQTSDAASLTGATTITTAEGTQAQVSDAATLSYIFPTYTIDFDGGAQTQSSDAAGLGVYYVLSVADATQAQTSDLIEISSALQIFPPGTRFVYELSSRSDSKTSGRVILVIGSRGESDVK